MSTTEPFTLKVNAKEISFHVANLTPPDAFFLSKVIATFCDPEHAAVADALRKGEAQLSYCAAGGVHLHGSGPMNSKDWRN